MSAASTSLLTRRQGSRAKLLLNDAHAPNTCYTQKQAPGGTAVRSTTVARHPPFNLMGPQGWASLESQANQVYSTID
jgi:hypothetical protein